MLRDLSLVCYCAEGCSFFTIDAVVQDAIVDLSMLIQRDPSNLDAHALMQDARAKEHAERRRL